MTAPSTTAARFTKLDPGLLARLLDEGYGPGAWHGADLKAALADIAPALAYWRPAPGRHNIAEIALHHGYSARAAHERLTGTPAEPFVLTGDDWFEADGPADLPWRDVLSTVDRLQARLSAAVAEIGRGALTSPLTAEEQFGLVLGVTCHAIYHAGQIQLIKKLYDR